MIRVFDRAIRDPAYGLLQNLLSRRAQTRHASDFENVRHFCLFVGYPRSGHSLVGALLNAHRNAVISHELDAPQWIQSGCTRSELFARIVTRAWWFNLRGNTSNYRYQVPNQWQGRFDSLSVIGDKRGGAVTRCIEADPTFLDRTRALVGVPLKLVHVVRNPFDNIAAISIWHQMTLPQATDYYLRHTAVTSRLGELTNDDEVIEVRHEDLVADPAAEVRRLCAFFELQPDEPYVAACADIVFSSLTRTRDKVQWSPELISRVENSIASTRFLAEYVFD